MQQFACCYLCACLIWSAFSVLLLLYCGSRVFKLNACVLRRTPERPRTGILLFAFRDSLSATTADCVTLLVRTLRRVRLLPVICWHLAPMHQRSSSTACCRSEFCLFVFCFTYSSINSSTSHPSYFCIFDTKRREPLLVVFRR